MLSFLVPLIFVGVISVKAGISIEDSDVRYLYDRAMSELQTRFMNKSANMKLVGHWTDDATSRKIFEKIGSEAKATQFASLEALTDSFRADPHLVAKFNLINQQLSSPDTLSRILEGALSDTKVGYDQSVLQTNLGKELEQLNGPLYSFMQLVSDRARADPIIDLEQWVLPSPGFNFQILYAEPTSLFLEVTTQVNYKRTLVELADEIGKDPVPDDLGLTFDISNVIRLGSIHEQGEKTVVKVWASVMLSERGRSIGMGVIASDDVDYVKDGIASLVHKSAVKGDVLLTDRTNPNPTYVSEGAHVASESSYGGSGAEEDQEEDQEAEQYMEQDGAQEAEQYMEQEGAQEAEKDMEQQASELGDTSGDTLGTVGDVVQEVAQVVVPRKLSALRVRQEQKHQKKGRRVKRLRVKTSNLLQVAASKPDESGISRIRHRFFIHQEVSAAKLNEQRNDIEYDSPSYFPRKASLLFDLGINFFGDFQKTSYHLEARLTVDLKRFIQCSAVGVFSFAKDGKMRGGGGLETFAAVTRSAPPRYTGFRRFDREAWYHKLLANLWGGYPSVWGTDREGDSQKSLIADSTFQQDVKKLNWPLRILSDGPQYETNLVDTATPVQTIEEKFENTAEDTSRKVPVSP
jgi:hypothetical protein